MNMTPTEGEEQATLFHWCEMVKGKYPELQLLFHIPNGGERRKSEAARMKAEGVKPGVPDLFLPVARGGYHGLFIEMKRREGWRISKEQETWIAALKEQGVQSRRLLRMGSGKGRNRDVLQSMTGLRPRYAAPGGRGERAMPRVRFNSAALHQRPGNAVRAARLPG